MEDVLTKLRLCIESFRQLTSRERGSRVRLSGSKHARRANDRRRNLLPGPAPTAFESTPRCMGVSEVKPGVKGSERPPAKRRKRGGRGRKSVLKRKLTRLARRRKLGREAASAEWGSSPCEKIEVPRAKARSSPKGVVAVVWLRGQSVRREEWLRNPTGHIATRGRYQGTFSRRKARGLERYGRKLERSKRKFVDLRKLLGNESRRNHLPSRAVEASISVRLDPLPSTGPVSRYRCRKCLTLCPKHKSGCAYVSRPHLHRG